MLNASMFLAVVALAAFAGAAPRSGAAGSPALQGRDPKPPNVVLIVADDLGYADVGAFGQRKIRTPHIDRLAADGIRLTQYYAGAPVCAPSRAVLMTGRHAGHAAIRDNREIKPEEQHPLPSGAVTIPELLRTRGYATGAVGKWGLGFPGSEGEPLNQGFDFFFGFNCQRKAHNHYPSYLWRNRERVPLDGNDDGLTGRQYSHDLMEREALQFIRGRRDRPFFLYVPFTIPHVALQVPEDSLAEYVGRWDDPPYTGGRGYLPHQQPRAAYAAMITRMDRSVGRIVDLLAELTLDRHTLVVFTSDNGPVHGGVGGADVAFFGSAGPFRGLKGSVYEGGIRVPFIAKWPGRIRPGTSSNRPVAAYDVLPTLSAAAGASVPSDVDGVSVLPTLLGASGQRSHDFFYWEFPARGYGGQQAVRLGKWKGVRQKMHEGRTQIELYDLDADIAEARDVAASHPDIVKRIEAVMGREHTPSADFPLPAVDGTVIKP